MRNPGRTFEAFREETLRKRNLRTKDFGDGGYIDKRLVRWCYSQATPQRTATYAMLVITVGLGYIAETEL